MIYEAMGRFWAWVAAGGPFGILQHSRREMLLAWTKEIVGMMVWKRARFQMYLEIRAIIIHLHWLWEKERKIKEDFRFGATGRIGLPFTEMRKPSEKVGFIRNKLADLENELMVARDEEWEEGIIRELGIDLHPLLRLKWSTNKVLLYKIENSG